MYIPCYTHNINHCRSLKVKLKAKVKVVEKTGNGGRRLSCSVTYLVNLAFSRPVTYLVNLAFSCPVTYLVNLAFSCPVTYLVNLAFSCSVTYLVNLALFNLECEGTKTELDHFT